MKKNEKGSALLWSLVVIGVLAILIAACLTISYSYYNRALQNNSKRQAYLTAKGVIEDMAENIQKGNEEYLSLFMDTSKDEYTPIVKEGESINLTVNLNNSLVPVGSIERSTIKINKIDKTMKGYITISVVATYAEQSYEVKADLKLGYIKAEKSDKWQLIRYYQNGEVDEVFNNITIASKLQNDYNLYYKIYSDKKAATGNQTLAMKTLLEELKKDKSWADVESSVQNLLEGSGNFNDDTMRKYFASRNEEHKFTQFSTDEIKGKDKILVPKVVDGKIKKVEVSLVAKGFFNNKYYIQPKFSNKYTMSFVFAFDKNYVTNWGNINLIFNDGHWYYIEEVRLSDDAEVKFLGTTSFDTDNAVANWNYLVSNFLTKDNMLQ